MTTIRRSRRLVIRATVIVLLAGVGIGCGAGAQSPVAPSGTSPSTATIDSVTTTFRGAVVESIPIVIEAPEALHVTVGATLRMPADSRVTMHLCVMETASAIGVGKCVAVTATVAAVIAQPSMLGMGIGAHGVDGVPRTTNYLYVGLTEGGYWPITGASPPRVGDTFGYSRVLATTQVARTVTFR